MNGIHHLGMTGNSLQSQCKLLLDGGKLFLPSVILQMTNVVVVGVVVGVVVVVVVVVVVFAFLGLV